ncbi:hypothetical protein OIU74_016668, partial [Salix koriyanagi]
MCLFHLWKNPMQTL